MNINRALVLRWCLYAFSGSLVCAVHAEDVREIVRRAFALNQKTEDLSQNYTFLQTERVRMLDGKGGVKRDSSKTEDITMLEGSPYRRLVARNGKPISPEEQKQEDERLRRSDEERRKEPPEQRERRLAEWRRRREQRIGPFREVLDAFDFKLAGEQNLNGVSVYAIDATPKQGYKPKSSTASILPKFKGRLWIAKSDYGLVKVEAETTGTISYGGILFRLARGSRVEVEQERVNDELWLRKRIWVEFSGHVLLVSALRAQIEFTFADYRKFQADSRMIPNGEKR